MSYIESILIALSFGIDSMIVMRNQAEKTNIRLTRAIGVSALISIIGVAMIILGIFIGDILRFETPDSPTAYTATNTLVFVGLTVVVTIRTLWGSLKHESNIAYDISRWSTVIALAIALGINLLIYGIGVGFLYHSEHIETTVCLPLFPCLFLLNYLGIMFGRQKTPLRERRWKILSSVLLLSIAIYCVIDM
ncbi:MAG: manganese efflux pump [Bacteroidales bacterium]|nr:manganese efflux pump [Bacteroidales bacterium]